MAPEYEWTDQDAQESASQGWSVFEIGGRDPETEAQIVNGKPYGHRPFELQAVDEAGVFSDDAAAWDFVKAQAVSGDALAVRAAEFLKAGSPREYAAIFGQH